MLAEIPEGMEVYNPEEYFLVHRSALDRLREQAEKAYLYDEEQKNGKENNTKIFLGVFGFLCLVFTAGGILGHIIGR